MEYPMKYCRNVLYMGSHFLEFGRICDLAAMPVSMPLMMAYTVFVKAQIGPNLGKCDPHMVLYDSTLGLHVCHILALTKSVMACMKLWLG
jgi:hypothetical protein